VHSAAAALLVREVWLIDKAFAYWRHLTDRTLTLELIFDDLEVCIEHIHLASAFDKWVDFLFPPESTTSHASRAPAAVFDRTEVVMDADKQNTPINEPWTPGSMIHKDWSWSQQLELLQSRRAEQDWLGTPSEAKTAPTPKSIADLVADMRETRLTHQAKMHKLRSELVAGVATSRALEITSFSQLSLPREETTSEGDYVSGDTSNVLMCPAAYSQDHTTVAYVPKRLGTSAMRESRGSQQEAQTFGYGYIPQLSASTPVRVHRSQGTAESDSTQWRHSTAALLDAQATVASRLFMTNKSVTYGSPSAHVQGSVRSHASISGQATGLTLNFERAASLNHSYEGSHAPLLQHVIQAQAELSARLAATDITE
jgi:hypothetical protein